MVDFVSSNRAAELAELGTSCPDHFLRTKIKPLLVDWDPASGDAETLQSALDDGLRQYREDYAAYYNACKDPESPAMRGGDPTVVLIPGVGMIGWGKSKSESRVTAEFYKCAIEVMRGAEAVDTYTALPRQEAFDIEYWALEEAKLQRMPAEKSLARRIAVVVGAGSGIGKELVGRLDARGRGRRGGRPRRRDGSGDGRREAGRPRNGHRRGRHRHRRLGRRDRPRAAT